MSAARRLLRIATVTAAACCLAACGTTGDAHKSSLGAPSPPTQPAFPEGARFDYQIGGIYSPDPEVRVVDRDRRELPAPDRYNVCYVNAFQTQAEETAWWRSNHPDLLLRDRRGREVVDEEWDEVLFDIRTEAKRRALVAVVGAWLDGCARDGFDAVEPDNLDSYTRSQGQLSAGHAVAFATLLMGRAHRAGLAIAQKNAADLASRLSAAGFDFAIAEECEVYDECATYTRAYGRAVVEIEYTDNGRAAFARACEVRGTTISVLLRDRDVLPAGEPGHVGEWC